VIGLYLDLFLVCLEYIIYNNHILFF